MKKVVFPIAIITSVAIGALMLFGGRVTVPTDGNKVTVVKSSVVGVTTKNDAMIGILFDPTPVESQRVILGHASARAGSFDPTPFDPTPIVVRPRGKTPGDRHSENTPRAAGPATPHDVESKTTTPPQVGDHGMTPTEGSL